VMLKANIWPAPATASCEWTLFSAINTL
jgi:hypothetical protein